MLDLNPYGIGISSHVISFTAELFRSLGYISFIIIACVLCSTIGTNRIPILFKVLPMAPLVIPLVPIYDTIGSDYWLPIMQAMALFWVFPL